MSQDAAFYLDPLRDIYEVRVTTLCPDVGKRLTDL